ncbi:MAG: hypothetical protein HDP28_02660 [Clostridia bacterium]|nr:hypothetical protein [Clostridia bacterium]
MKSVIEDILRGDFGLTKRVSKFIKNSKTLDEIIKYDEELTALLKKDSKKRRIFQKFKSAMDEHVADESTEYYKAGFCIGFRLALEVLNADS